MMKRNRWRSLAALATMLTAGGAAPQDANWRIFRDPALGLSFAYPPAWMARVGCHASRRCIALTEGEHTVDEYVMALEVFRGGLDWTAATKSVFRRQSDGWVAHGRFADHPAERIEGEVWNGLEAVVDCGISVGGGVHAAAGECLWAVLSDGRMSVVADTQGMSPVGDDIRRVIRSVRFTRS